MSGLNSERSGSVNFSNIQTVGVVCGHNIPAALLTSMSDDNPARRFFRCPLRDEDDCNYFVWHDPELPSFQKGSFLRMKCEIIALRENVLFFQILGAERKAMQTEETKKNSEQSEMFLKRITALELFNGEILKQSMDQNMMHGLERNKWSTMVCGVLIFVGCISFGVLLGGGIFSTI